MRLLDDVAVVDAHCHGWRMDEVRGRDQHGFLDRVTMLGMCVISSRLSADSGRQVVEHATDTSPIALTMARRLSERLGCEPTREGLAAARAQALERHEEHLRGLWADAGLVALLMDDGYPLPKIDVEALGEQAGLPVHRVARIEPPIVELRDGVRSYAELEDAFVAELDAAVDHGAIAFKSVIAYRTGLDVAWYSPDTCAQAFRRWREADWSESREWSKPVRDMLLRRTLEVATRRGVPLHIHSGGGDSDTVLAHARPANLAPLLAEYVESSVLLIHGGWPWVEEAAYIASTLPHVYLETSLSTPWATLGIDARLQSLMGMAAPSKVLYGSDEATEPEVLWLSAVLARESLERVLAQGIEHGWFDAAQAKRIGAQVLGENARRLHRLA